MLRDELHESVLKSEVIKALSIKPDGLYIDCLLYTSDAADE